MPIKIENCSFSYRRNIPVLRDLSMSFKEGNTVLLGPNGAGKSTLMSLAASELEPDRGQISLVDGPARASRRELREYRRRVSWLPQQVRPVGGLRVREQVAYAGWLKGMTRRAAWDASQPALGSVALSDLAHRRSSELSGGQLRRLGIAQALVHEAEVVLMDEPTADLDPLQRAGFRELLENLPGTVSTIVSTHQTEDLADTYDEVVVLEKGTVKFQGSVSDFLATASPDAAPGRQAESAYARFVKAEV
ncbi:ATP-binding cassette domain-containing protein [Streptomyces carpaticus]|uniref:ATP-binding cassette domain-containing protein n=1 Tax=Streptomyces carpaticus TaxID=285558 RepID=UPI0031F9CB00